MKRFFSLLLTISVLTTPLMSLEGNFYITGFAGANFVSDDLDDFDLDYCTGYAVSVQGGYALKCGLRTEIEASYRHNQIDDVKFVGNSTNLKGDLDVWAILLNAHLHLPAYFCIAPYVGGGIGWDCEKIDLHGDDLDTVEDKDHHFAYQGIFGIAYPLADCLELSLEYRFFHFEEDAEAHTVGLSITKLF